MNAVSNASNFLHVAACAFPNFSFLYLTLAIIYFLWQDARFGSQASSYPCTLNLLVLPVVAWYSTVPSSFSFLVSPDKWSPLASYYKITWSHSTEDDLSCKISVLNEEQNGSWPRTIPVFLSWGYFYSAHLVSQPNTASCWPLGL